MKTMFPLYFTRHGFGSIRWPILGLVLAAWLAGGSIGTGREWLNPLPGPDGKKLIEAEFVSCDGKEVTLQLPDGKIVPYLLSFFSKDDQIYATFLGEIRKRSAEKQGQHIIVLQKKAPKHFASGEVLTLGHGWFASMAPDSSL